MVGLADFEHGNLEVFCGASTGINASQPRQQHLVTFIVDRAAQMRLLQITTRKMNDSWQCSA